VFTKNETRAQLDAEIRELLDKLNEISDKTSDDYGAILERISKLHKLKAEESPKRISPDTALVVGANLVGILAIVHHEHAHAITSKAIGFILKP
jgi:threonine dehydrogenase-like Zn-dependent dehydrogenase